MSKRLSLSAISVLTILLMSGCGATLKPTRIPEFIERLQVHDFSESERVTIGEILDYVNDLENE
tara:strand:+ start:432 stop:623 length:192 start_codon:yes stop_codon:yes gene_type:complete